MQRKSFPLLPFLYFLMSLCLYIFKRHLSPYLLLLCSSSLKRTFKTSHIPSFKIISTSKYQRKNRKFCPHSPVKNTKRKDWNTELSFAPRLANTENLGFLMFLCFWWRKYFIKIIMFRVQIFQDV